MPSKSKKQARLMAAVAHNPKFAKKVGISQTVGREFNNADRLLRKYAKGGGVLPSSTEDEESWSDTYVKRPLSGLASMWSATDPETGELVNPAWHNIKRVLRSDARRKAGLPREEMATLGIVDEALSLPALGEIVGLPAPKFAKDAEERASTTRNAAREALNLDAPHGFVENLTESAGVMAGQLPVPGSVANRLKILKESGKLGKAGKVLAPAVEWFSPTVVPKAKNYLQGTLFGGGIGGALDYAEDYMGEKEQEKRNQQFISEAMAEVLEEERVKAAQESGDDASDDEALAELGYAEGGRVKQAKRVIGSLRSILSETDAEDVATRKAAIDQAIAALKGTAGPTEMDRVQLHTLNAGLSDAAATPVPERRRQRFGDYERNILDLLENRVAPTLQDPTIPRDIPPVANYPAPAPLPRPDLTDPQTRIDQDMGPMRPEQRYNPSGGADNRRGTLTQEEWEKMLGIKRQFASGGKVTNQPWAAPQSQKEPVTTGAGSTVADGTPQGRTGAPLSQEWYENYGAGPEHLFLGDRKLDLHEYWGPKHYGAVPQVQQQADGSWLPAAGIIGFSLYDEWKKKRAEGQDSSQAAFWQDMHNSAANTADTDAWVNQQLGEYANSAPMPQLNEDGTISYIQPNQFWSDVHKSASSTANTDAWVNSQLDQYGSNMAMPHMNEDGTISYTDNKGNVIDPNDPNSGFNLGRGLSGVQGAYGLYSGLEQGGVQGYANALSGANDLYGAWTGEGTGNLGAAAGTVGGLASIYGGIKQGGVQGYSQALGGAAQTAQALGYGTSGAVGALGTAAGVVGGLYAAYGAYESAKVGDKKGAVSQGAAAGAAIGSVIPVVGTAVGAVVGAVVGLIGASLGDKQQKSEMYYGAHKKLDKGDVIRGWTDDQVGGAVFETIKSHTKSGNVNKFKDVGEMYTAFGITKDAHKNYKNVQAQMGDFIKGVVETAQQMGALPTDPAKLKELDGQQIYYKVVVPAMAAKYKETTGKDSTAWSTDKIKPGQGSAMHELMADWTDWMTSSWGQDPSTVNQKPKSTAAPRGNSNPRMQERARGGRVQSFHDDPRSGALSALQ